MYLARPRHQPADWIKTGIHVVLYALGIFAACTVIVGVLIVLLLMSAPSRGHGPAQWIQDGQYKNAVGELCCGERDCAELADGDVKITAAGYLIKSLDETVPFSEATPSPDGKYWRCYWGGKRKCFFAPPPNT